MTRIFHQFYLSPSSSQSQTLSLTIRICHQIKLHPRLTNPPRSSASDSSTSPLSDDFLEFAWGQPRRGKEARVRAGIKRCASSRLTTSMNNSWTAFPHTARMLFWERGRTQESVDNDLSLALLPPSLSFSLTHTHSFSPTRFYGSLL